jgi:hypothetical protein
MKKLLILVSVLAISCTGLKKIDTVGFHSSENVIMYEKDTVATLSAIEYSIDNGKYVKEMTFKLVDMNHADKVKNLLYFVHKQHKGWEIELDYPINNFKVNK